MKTTLATLGPLSLLALAACSGDPESGAPSASAAPAARGDGPLVVLAVNHPLALFAERIGGEHVDVRFPAPPDVDPAHWDPSRDVRAAFQAADVVLSNGAGYARWTRTAALPVAAVVDTSRGFRERLIQLEGSIAHSHGPEGEHDHGGTAFTTWMDPELAALQAEAVRDALVLRRPEAEGAFDAGLAELRSELDAIDAELRSVLESDADRPLLASHPVYPYLARAYGLNLRSLHWEPDAMPDDAAWAELEDLLAEHPARILLWEARPDAAIAERLGELGVRGVVLPPCGNVPPEGDFLAALRRGVDDLRRAWAETR